MESRWLLHGLPPQNPDGKNQTCARQRHEHIMGKLKDSIFTTLMGSNPSGTLTQEAKSYIENKLHVMFQNFDTPTHPPYASMIRTAIIELNEEAGSSEESISGFIEKEYEGLPCGHVAFLSHHLRRLCESGEIVHKNDGRYMIGVDYEQKLEEDCQAERQELEIIDDYSKVKEKQIVVFEEQQQHAVEKCEVEEQSETLREGIEATEQQIEVLYRTEGPSVELNDEEKNCPQNQLHEVIEETNHLKKLQIEVCEKYMSVHGQQNRMIEEKNMFQEQQTQLLYLTQGPSEELNDEEQNCPQNQQHEVIEELNGIQKLHLEVCEEYMSVSRQQNRVIEEKNMLEEQQTEV
ncbi:hypothetical protein Patl1_15404 [Pistacia atlantica]|uniref:Uncharacterized protein n=1 Tax=Pistacia atlantica TaxID=434234 RepID=A0ACC1B5G0_9ROSI|nr:hypothetical protein Patl1_15404 [Pistacia atlantica]